MPHDASALVPPSRPRFGDNGTDPAAEPVVDSSLAEQPLAIVAVLIAWCAVGLVVAAVLARRGHASRPLGALGLVLGPLLIGYAYANLRWREQMAKPVVLREGRPLGGTERVLVAMLGEPSAVADVLPVLRSSAGRLARVDIGCVVSFEDAEAPQSDEETQRAIARLEQAAVFLEEYDPGLVLLPGRARESITRYVESASADMIVVAGDDGAQSALCDDHHLRTITMVLGTAHDQV